MASPVNDNFSNRVLLTGSTFSVNGTNSEATLEPGETYYSAEGYSCDNSVWYEYVPAQDGVLHLDTNGSSVLTDSVLWVFTGDSVNGLTLVDYDDDLGDGYLSSINVNVVAGTSYKIAITGYSPSDEGAFKLTGAFNTTSRPANDNSEDAQDLTGESFLVSAINTLATMQTGEEAGNYRSIWYSWVAPYSGTLTVNASSSAVSVIVRIYHGDVLAELEGVKSGYGTASCSVIKGVGYRIALCDRYNAGGLVFARGTFVAGVFPMISYAMSGTNGNPLSDKYIVRESGGRIWAFRMAGSDGALQYSDDDGKTWANDSHLLSGKYPAYLFIDDADTLYLVWVTASDVGCTTRQQDGTWSSDAVKSGYGGGYGNEAFLHEGVIHYLVSGGGSGVHIRLYHLTFQSGVWSSEADICNYPNTGRNRHQAKYPHIVLYDNELYVLFAYSFESDYLLLDYHYYLCYGRITDCSLSTTVTLLGPETSDWFFADPPFGPVRTSVAVPYNSHLYIFHDLGVVDYTTEFLAIVTSWTNVYINGTTELDDGRTVLFFSKNTGGHGYRYFVVIDNGVWASPVMFLLDGGDVDVQQSTIPLSLPIEGWPDFYFIRNNLFWTADFIGYDPKPGPRIPIDCGQVGQILALDVATQTLAPSTVPDATMDCACCAPVLSSYDCGSEILEAP